MKVSSSVVLILSVAMALLASSALAGKKGGKAKKDKAPQPSVVEDNSPPTDTRSNEQRLRDFETAFDTYGVGKKAFWKEGEGARPMEVRGGTSNPELGSAFVKMSEANFGGYFVDAEPEDSYTGENRRPQNRRSGRARGG